MEALYIFVYFSDRIIIYSWFIILLQPGWTALVGSLTSCQWPGSLFTDCYLFLTQICYQKIKKIIQKFGKRLNRKQQRSWKFILFDPANTLSTYQSIFSDRKRKIKGIQFYTITVGLSAEILSVKNNLRRPPEFEICKKKINTQS